MNTNTHFVSHPVQFFLEWEMFHTKVVERIKTHFMFNNFSIYNRAVYEIMWGKNCTAGHAKDDNMAHAHCMLDNWSYRHTLRICNTQCFSTAEIVARMLLIINLLEPELFFKI